MLRSSQLTKCLTLAMTIAALGASTASARPAGHQAVAPIPTPPQWTQPRVDSPGVRPVVRASRPAQPIPLVQPATESGFDWLSVVLGASGLLCLSLLVIIARSIRAPHRGRIAPPSA